MKVYSMSFKVLQYVFQNNKKCLSYDALNGHRYSKKLKGLIFNRSFWEAIQAMGVKFLLETCDHLGYPYTKFRPILKWSCAKLQ